jgi:hypothetical protein
MESGDRPVGAHELSRQDPRKKTKVAVESLQAGAVAESIGVEFEDIAVERKEHGLEFRDIAINPTGVGVDLEDFAVEWKWIGAGLDDIGARFRRTAPRSFCAGTDVRKVETDPSPLAAEPRKVAADALRPDVGPARIPARTPAMEVGDHGAPLTLRGSRRALADPRIRSCLKPFDRSAETPRTPLQAARLPFHSTGQARCPSPLPRSSVPSARRSPPSA